MKLLITGSNGQLGNELKRCLETMESEIGSIPAEYKGAQTVFVDRETLDISDRCAVHSYFEENAPFDVVINCAAMTNVDGCDADEASAYHVNAEGPENLGSEVARTGGKFVQVSTDYVFSGTEARPREETDLPMPISGYGRSKWAGEVLSAAVCPQTFIVRTAWLYGYVGKNFVKTMFRLARESGKISVVSDQVGNPTNANDLAYEILKLALTDGFGIYHCTNNGTCSWFDFASAVVDMAGIPCEKEPLTSAEYKKRFPQSAHRPAYSSLKNKHLAQTIGDEMRPWKEALATYMANLEAFGS